jgi:L-amino acid N-acyltransferase YncA
LLPALMDACAFAGCRQLIGYIDGANTASLQLHESFGFTRVGLLAAVGFKFGQWVDSVTVQRALGPGDTLAGLWTQTPPATADRG